MFFAIIWLPLTPHQSYSPDDDGDDVSEIIFIVSLFNATKPSACYYEIFVTQIGNSSHTINSCALLVTTSSRVS